MRPANKITAESENFRLEGGFIKRDPVEPEPVGTIVLKVFRVTGYDSDCDGSLMARMENIDSKGGATGWEVDSIGIYPDCDLVVSPDELKALFDQGGRGE